MSKLRIKTALGDEPVEVQIDPDHDAGGNCFVVQTGDAREQVEHETVGPGVGWLRIGGRVLRYYATRRNGRMSVWIDGRVYEIEILDRAERRSAGGGDHAGPAEDLTAPMPGTILKINVSAGDRFEAHDALIIMESMKMEMTLSAAHAGRVTSIKCGVGDLVEMGAVLAELGE